MACELSPDPIAFLETLLTDSGVDDLVFGGGSAVPGGPWGGFFDLGSSSEHVLAAGDAAPVFSNNKTQLDAVWPEELFTVSTSQLNQYIRRAHLSPDQEEHLKQARRRYKSRGYARKARTATAAATAEPSSPPASASSLSTTMSPLPRSSSGGAGTDELHALQAELASLRRSVQEAHLREQQLRSTAAQRGIPIPF